MNIVFVLTSGDEDSIEKVFTNKEKLDKYVEVLEKTGERLEYIEVEIDPEPPTLYKYAEVRGDILEEIDSTSYAKATADPTNFLKYFKIAELNPTISIEYSTTPIEGSISRTTWLYEMILPVKDDETDEELKAAIIEIIKQNIDEYKEEIPKG